jgi:hypothetical protein
MASRSMRQSTRCLYELDCMKRLFVSVFVLVLFVSGAELVSADEEAAAQKLVSVTMKTADETTQTIIGRVLFKAPDSGLLVETREGRLWTVTPDILVATKETDTTFEYRSNEEFGEHLQHELAQAGVASGSVIHSTEHYVICSTAGKPYALWAGQMLERLFKAFRTYWKSRGFEMPEPNSPMPVLILADRAEFAKLAIFDKTPGSAKGNGYFLITANRIVLFDLTNSAGQQAAKTISDIQRRVQKIPGNVGVVVHEATHQIAFNTDLHKRYADNPIWMTEGMAMYFETPDLRSRRGWSTIGRVNSSRLARYLDYIRKRKQGTSLAAIVQNSERFTKAETALDAYAESWAVTHYLIKTKNRNYAQYLAGIAAKPRFRWDSDESHLKEFEQAFGDIDQLDKKVQAFAKRLKR